MTGSWFSCHVWCLPAVLAKMWPQNMHGPLGPPTTALLAPPIGKQQARCQ